MNTVQTIQLDISRVGHQMIFKVTSLDANGDEIAHAGWHTAKALDHTDAAIEEAQTLASEWCRQHGLKTFMTYDHRVYDSVADE